MASLGNIGWYTKYGGITFHDPGFGSITLAQSSFARAAAIRYQAFNYYTIGKAPTSVIIAIPGVTPNSQVTLLRNGQLVDVTASITTTAYFYDYQDGTYSVIDNATGATWSVVIVGALVTVVANSPNSGVLRPTTGQIFPLGNFYGGVPSLMSALDGVTISSIGTTTTTVPSTVTEVEIWLRAKGGPGGTSTASGQAAGGGGGGGSLIGIYPVTPGSTLTTVLSATGASSVTGMTSGTAVANAGATGTSTTGGVGGTASGGSSNYTGQQGGSPFLLGSASGSGLGGCCVMGGAGGSFAINAVGNAGQFPGGGGSGGSGVNGGGAGAGPECIMRWVQ